MTKHAAEGDRPEGEISAAILATGVGATALGIVTVLAEASTTVKDWLQWSTAWAVRTMSSPPFGLPQRR